MKFNNVKTINYINHMINMLIHHNRLNHKEDEVFVLVFKGFFLKHEIRSKSRKQKLIYLGYESDFYYKSKDGSFSDIRKPYLYLVREIPFTNKRKERLKLCVEENEFIKEILHNLLTVIALGRGCLGFHGILAGTAELGVNDKRTPLEIIKGQKNE